MKRSPDWVINPVLSVVSLGVCVFLLEVCCRLFPCKEYDDDDVWILPFDQHPNEKANAVFTERLVDEFRRRGLPQRHTETTTGHVGEQA
jgi:hypothetical protein